MYRACSHGRQSGERLNVFFVNNVDNIQAITSLDSGAMRQAK
jgi:hypothetical protein